MQSEELIDCKASNTALESIINNLKTAQHELLEVIKDSCQSFYLCHTKKVGWKVIRGLEGCPTEKSYKEFLQFVYAIVLNILLHHKVPWF